MKCYRCHKPLQYEVDYKFSRSEECPSCSADLRCCKMCQHYDLSSYNECREPSADRVIEKEKGNFCDYFHPSTQTGDNNAPHKDALAAANKLFKD